MASEQPSFIDNSDDTNTFVSGLINQMVSNIPIKTHKNFSLNNQKIDNLLTDKTNYSKDFHSYPKITHNGETENVFSYNDDEGCLEIDGTMCFID